MTQELIIDRLRDKRVGLVLSAGFFGFYHQAGVLSSLIEAGVSPARISGNSAGAVVGALYASGLDPDEIREVLLGLKREDFWDLHFPFGPDGFSLLAGHRFQAILGRFLLSHSFESCRLPLTIGAFDMDSGRMTYIDSGALIPAVYASSAVPYLFAPLTIGGRRYWDGGFAEKSPMVPFLKQDDIDIVVVSYLPQRGQRTRRPGIRGLLPPLSALFADIPYEERLERDKASLKALETAGKEVLFLKPPHVSLGPFTMARAGEAFNKGRDGATSLLTATLDAASSPW